MNVKFPPFIICASFLFLIASLFAGLAQKQLWGEIFFSVSFCLFGLFYIFRFKKTVTKPALSLIPVVLVAGLIAFWLLRQEGLLQGSLSAWLEQQSRRASVYVLPAGVGKGLKEDLIRKSEKELFLSENRDQPFLGYLKRDILPQFSRLTDDLIRQLSFLQVKNLIVDSAIPQLKTFQAKKKVTVMPFNKVSVVKIPAHRNQIEFLYGAGFNDALVKGFPDSTRWVSGKEGIVYLHNNLDRVVIVNLSARIVSTRPVKAGLKRGPEIKTIGLNQTPLLFQWKDFILRPGKNSLSLIVQTEPGSGNPVRAGIVDFKIEFTGISPLDLAKEKGNVFPVKKYLKWFHSLPADTRLLEYPLVNKNWQDPVDYASLTGGSRNINFKFESLGSGFTRKKFTNEPYPGLVWQLNALGIAYVTVHPSLMDHPPKIFPESGLIEVQRLGDSVVYKAKTQKVLLESESMVYSRSPKVIDQEASGNLARYNEGAERIGRYLVYGPYAPIKPGKYKVTYRLKVRRIDSKPVAKLDVTANQGSVILAERLLKAGDFKKAQTYQDFYLGFKLENDTEVEFRVQFMGKENGLWSDWILVEQLTEKTKEYD